MSADVTSGGRARPEQDRLGDPAPVLAGPDPSEVRGPWGSRAPRGSWLRPAVWLPLAVALAVLAGLWTLVAATNPFVLPTLPTVAEALTSNLSRYLGNAGATLGIAAAGLGIGFATAGVLAVAVSEVTVLRRALVPLAVVLNVTPVVALAPGLGVAFGLGLTPKVVVTAIIVFFPVLVNTSAGLRSVDPGALQVLTTLDASRAEVFWRLRVPSAAPYVFAALRVVVPLSLVGAVVAEFVTVGTSAGLGTVIRNTSTASQLDSMYAAVFCLAVMGVALLALLTTAERRALHWHDSQRPSR